MSLLEVKDINQYYGGSHILRNANLTAELGQVTVVLGRNGVGKTTLLKAVMGLADVKAGQVRLDGQDITKWSARERAHAGIGYVPQTRDIFPSLTVEENLLAGLKGRARSALDEAYALFPRLAERRQNGGQQLSGGEQQMLSVARTLLGKPRLLLLDEPLEGLAPIICIELMRAFEHLAQDTGVAVLLVEQKVDDALRFAPRAVVLERGEVVLKSESAALSQRKDLLERYVGVAGAH